MTPGVAALLVAIPCVVLFFQLATGWLVKSLEGKIESVHTAVNSNLSEAQVKLNDALVRIEQLEHTIREFHDRNH